MLHAARRCFVDLLAVLGALAAFTTAAFAEGLTIEPSGEVDLPSTGNLRFTSSLFDIACPVTFEGSLEEGPILMSSGEPIGETTGMAIDEEACEGGGVLTRALLESPWTTRYQAVTGTLPNEVTSTRVLIDDVAVSGSIGGISCLYQGDPILDIAVSGANPYDLDTISVEAAGVFRKVSGLFCPATASASGTLSIAPATQVRARSYIATPPIVDFGEVKVNEPELRTTSLENMSGSNTTVTRVEEIGASEVFDPVNDPPIPINNGSAVTYRINFRPGLVAGYEIRYVLRNAAGTTLYTIDVFGIGRP